jgi:hypothetical protein
VVLLLLGVVCLVMSQFFITPKVGNKKVAVH